MVGAALHPAGHSVVAIWGSKISESFRAKQRSSPDSIAYKIPCAGCDSSYYGETSRGLVVRVKEHRSDDRHHRSSSVLVNYINTTDFDSLPAISHGCKNHQLRHHQNDTRHEAS
ncbi:hypothetical protein E2C01_074071 [Portunus trituberculatus]|uniref:GIY-YIG domain-containing protein n=1 Tax=Portunus trituberculatus TaxID=210409 RepID=A0A5B7I726_PORTR|nr:hypothetical protein [Portunus trituberculatus]